MKRRRWSNGGSEQPTWPRPSPVPAVGTPVVWHGRTVGFVDEVRDGAVSMKLADPDLMARIHAGGGGGMSVSYGDGTVEICGLYPKETAR